MLELTIRLIVSLAIVIGLLLLLARFGARKFKGSTGALVNVVHRQALSRTSSVAVVTVGTRILVLGTTEQQISVLAELDPDELDPNAVEGELLALDAAPTAEFGEFADVLHAAQAQVEPPAPAKPVKPAAPARPQARPASKAPAWNPNDALRSLPTHGAPKTGNGAGSSAAVDAILAAVDAHSNKAAVPPALAILADESDSAPAEPRRLALTRQAPVESHGRLSGSVLSAQTWKQAFAAVTSRRAS